MTSQGPNMAKKREKFGGMPTRVRNMLETFGGFQNRLAKTVFGRFPPKNLLFPRELGQKFLTLRKQKHAHGRNKTCVT